MMARIQRNMKIANLIYDQIPGSRRVLIMMNHTPRKLYH